MNEREIDNTTENNKTNKNNLQTILEQNKHDYMKIQTMIIKNNQLAEILSRQKPQANKIMIKSSK